MNILLSIDLSTTCTGWSIFEMDTKKLVTYGTIKGKNFKDSSKWRALLKKMDFIGAEILNLISTYKPTHIVIEEIAGSKNRIGQKTLDMAHGITWKWIEPYLDIVHYFDVGGEDGWRTFLKMRQSEEDKKQNKISKKFNKTVSKGTDKLREVGWKELSCRHVNTHFGLALDSWENQYDADIADSISMGHSFLLFKYTP